MYNASVGVKSPDQTMGLGPSIEFNPVWRESAGARKAPDPIPMGLNLL